MINVTGSLRNCRCGGSARVTRETKETVDLTYGQYNTKNVRYIVSCLSCKMTAASMPTLETAVGQWNK